MSSFAVAFFLFSFCFGMVGDEGPLGCLDGLNTMVKVG